MEGRMGKVTQFAMLGTKVTRRVVVLEVAQPSDAIFDAPMVLFKALFK
jgi:hypothetical protein